MIRLLRLLPRELQDDVGKLLYWGIGIPLLILTILGAFVIGSTDSGALGGVLALAKIGLVLWLMLLILGLLGRAFMFLGTRLERYVGESAASVVALIVVGGLVAAAAWLGANVMGMR